MSNKKRRMQQPLSDIRSHNFIIIVANINKNQKMKLIEIFKPSEIRIKKIDDQLKLLFTKCRQSMNQDQIRKKAMNILYQEVQVRLLQQAAIKILSPYETQDSDSSSQTEQHRKDYVKQSIELMRQKNKSDSLKKEIQIKMENRMKLSEIIHQYSDPIDQRMIGEFWNMLKEYESMLLEKEPARYQKNQINQSQIMDIESIKNEKIVKNQKTQQIIKKKNGIHQKNQEDLNEEEEEEKKDQKIGTPTNIGSFGPQKKSIKEVIEEAQEKAKHKQKKIQNKTIKKDKGQPTITGFLNKRNLSQKN